MYQSRNFTQTSLEASSSSARCYSYFTTDDTADVIMQPGYFPSDNQTASYVSPTLLATGDRIGICDSANNRFEVAVKVVNGVITLVPAKPQIIEIDVYNAQVGRGIYNALPKGYLSQIDVIRNGNMTAGSNGIVIYRGANTTFSAVNSVFGDSGIYTNLNFVAGVSRTFNNVFTSPSSISPNDFVNVTTAASGSGTFNFKINIYMALFNNV